MDFVLRASRVPPQVAELTASGVDPKYVTELAHYDPAAAISKDYKLGGRVGGRK